MEQLVIVLHVLTCVTLVAMVLLQQGKGADIGAAFGSGASNTVFGSAGSSSFLFKLTAFLAVIFFATSLGLGYIASHNVKRVGVFDNLPETAKVQTNTSPAPVSPASSDMLEPEEAPAKSQ